MSAAPHILRGAWVMPISGPPIPHGEVVLQGDRIVSVRPATSEAGPGVEDFGDAILLPGLVNVHTHLDYTVMRGLLEDLEFFPWIRELTARAMTLTPEDWLASAMWGAVEAVAGGVTTLGDCTFSGAAFEAARVFGLGGIIYREVFGIDELRTVDVIVAELRDSVERMCALTPGPHLRAGISPHAPYTVRPALLRALADYAGDCGLPLCIHAAESQAEAQLLRSGTGPFADMYVRRSIDWHAPGGSTVAYLDSLGIVTERTLLVHGVQVSAGDRALVQQRGAAWAHCPKSNAKLGAGVAPLGILLGRCPTETGSGHGRVGLGSDSVASNNTMDLFEEIRFAVLLQRGARRQIAAFGTREAVEMATLGGARALGMEAEIGTLEPGKRADICVVGLGAPHSFPAYDPYSALVYASRASDVLATYIGGEPRYDARLGPSPEDRFLRNDIAPIRQQLGNAARKMSEWRPAT